MLVPLSWLKDYVDINISADELEKKLFDCGFIGINAAVFQYLLIYHTSAEDLDPACFLAQTAALAAALEAAYIDLNRRLREREIGRTKSRFCLLTENSLNKHIQHTL